MPNNTKNSTLHYAKQYEELYASTSQFIPFDSTGTIIATLNTNNINTISTGSNSTLHTSMWIFVAMQDSLGLGTNNRVIMGLVADPTTGIVTHYCGQWQPSLYVPTQYLPGGCNATNIANAPGMVN